MSVNRPAPFARGNFSQKPFAHIFAYIWRQKVSGSLEIDDIGDTIIVAFDRGIPVGAQSDNAPDTPMEHLLMALLSAKTGHYDFYRDVHLLDPRQDTPCRPEAILVRGARTLGSDMDINPVINGLKGKWFSLASDIVLDRFSFNDVERQVVEQMGQTPTCLDQMKGWTNIDNNAKKTVLYALLLTGCVSIEAEPSTGETQRVSGPSSGRSPADRPCQERMHADATVTASDTHHDSFRERIREKTTHLESSTYYALLNVSKDANAIDIRKAFMNEARVFHPDKASKPELADLRDPLSRIFAALSEAHATLTNPQHRADYDATLVDNTDVASSEDAAEIEVRRAMTAENAFQKALVMVKKNQFKEAFELAEVAVAESDGDEYQALLNYLQVVYKEADPRPLVEGFRVLTRHNPKSERIHFFCAQILKRAGKQAEAKHQFEKVVAINPHNIDAAREIRLIELALRKSGKFKKPGLFNRFKKQ